MIWWRLWPFTSRVGKRVVSTSSTRPNASLSSPAAISSKLSQKSTLSSTKCWIAETRMCSYKYPAFLSSAISTTMTKTYVSSSSRASYRKSTKCSLSMTSKSGSYPRLTRAISIIMFLKNSSSLISC